MFSASPQVRLHNRLLEQAKIIQSEGQQAQEEQHGRSGPWAHQSDWFIGKNTLKRFFFGDVVQNSFFNLNISVFWAMTYMGIELMNDNMNLYEW